jgi:hypothetical protein
MSGREDSTMPPIRNDRTALDRRLGKRVYLCSFKDFYCEHAKKDQITVCQECPVEEEQLEKARKTIRDHLEKGSKKIQF